MRLEELNQERRRVELAVRTAAVAEVDHRPHLPDFLVVSGAWHEGVIGIVAARLAERYRRPAAVVALADGAGKGSARSGGAGDLAGALADVAPHFTKWGGHRGAAGFSLAPGGLAGLEDELAAVWRERWGRGSVPAPTVDAEVSVSDLTPELARFLARLEPFGHGFEAPRFRVSGLVVESATMGTDGEHMRLKLFGERAGSVAFGRGAYAEDLPGRWLVGRAGLSLGQYRGREQVQIRWDAIEDPPGPAGPLDGHPWERGRPPDRERVLVLVGSARAAARLAPSLPEHWHVSSWWRPDLTLGAFAGWTALWIQDAPPHAAALRSAVGQLVADGVVYWEERALSGSGVLAKWTRLVPDRQRLLALWQGRRASRRGLVPGGRVLQDLGLDGGEVPGTRRDLGDSGRWVAARHEYDRAQRDWRLGGPLVWREHMKGATTVGGTRGEAEWAADRQPRRLADAGAGDS
jgi:single-stranded-DNA-specific exonuclease